MYANIVYENHIICGTYMYSIEDTTTVTIIYSHAGFIRPTLVYVGRM